MEKKERKTTIAKTKEGYGYKYTELAEINKYCENNGITYYQEVDTCDVNGKDYIVTYITEDGETKAHRGCQVVEARLQGIKNPVQEYGSSLTYCRRYSLLMALGLSTEDDDGAMCGELTKKQAEAYKFAKGKKAGMTIMEVYKDDPKYLQWCLDNGQNEKVKEMITMLTGLKQAIVPSNEDEQRERLELINKIVTTKDIDEIKENYKIESIDKLSTEDLEAIVNG